MAAILKRALPHLKREFSLQSSRSFSSIISSSIGLTDEQIEFQRLAQSFCENEITPFAHDWDERKECPNEMFQKAAELGFGTLYIKHPEFGTGASRLETSIVFEALAEGCVSATAFLTIHNMTCWILDEFGSDELKERYLPDLSTCTKMGSYCLTEPSSGSDAASLKTRATKDGDHWVLNGQKVFISGGGHNDLYFVMARSGDNSAKGISCFVVEKGTPGLSFGAPEKKMGWNNQPTAQVYFEDCRIPASNLVGTEGSGFKIAMAGLDGGRINIAACSLGGAQRCLQDAVKYSQERTQFGKSISSFQYTQFKLADMATDLQAARLMVRQAAKMLDENDPQKTAFCAAAKRFATDTGFRVCNEALQIHGGYGYLKDYQVERFVRDTRVNQILEGTNEIMRMIVSRALPRDAPANNSN